MKTINIKKSSILLSMILASSCGGETAGDKAKSATDAVVNKTTDIKDAITGKEETKEENINKLDKQMSDLRNQISSVEESQRLQAVPAIQTANKTHLERLKTSYTTSEARMDEFKKSTDAEWKIKKEAAVLSIDNTKAKITDVLEREKLKADLDQKMKKVAAKIEALKAEASSANAEAKQKLDASRNNLETKYEELKLDHARFQESSEEKWDDFKEGFSNSFKELSNAFTGLFD